LCFTTSSYFSSYAWKIRLKNISMFSPMSGAVIGLIGGIVVGQPRAVASHSHITAVVMPQEGWGNIEELFPDPVLSLIYGNAFDAAAAMQRLERRQKDPSIPPLIVEQGTEMPMPDYPRWQIWMSDF
jgi:hypothetical protein